MPVESLQPFDRHPFNVGTCANHGVSVIVPEKRCREGPLLENSQGIVLPHLMLIPDDRHFAVQILLGNEGIHHSIGFEFQCPLQVVFGSLKCLKVVGPVERRGAVWLSSMVLKLLVDINMIPGALEHEVLQQMGHPGLAVILVARSNHVSDVDRNIGLGGIREKQDAEPVLQPVFTDSFDSGHVLHAGRKRDGRLLPV